MGIGSTAKYEEAGLGGAETGGRPSGDAWGVEGRRGVSLAD